MNCPQPKLNFSVPANTPQENYHAYTSQQKAEIEATFLLAAKLEKEVEQLKTIVKETNDALQRTLEALASAAGLTHLVAKGEAPEEVFVWRHKPTPPYWDAIAAPTKDGYELRVYRDGSNGVYACSDSNEALPTHWGERNPRGCPKGSTLEQAHEFGKAQVIKKLEEIRRLNPKKS